jgi:hypothetical protein
MLTGNKRNWLPRRFQWNERLRSPSPRPSPRGEGELSSVLQEIERSFKRSPRNGDCNKDARISGGARTLFFLPAKRDQDEGGYNRRRKRMGETCAVKLIIRSALRSAAGGVVAARRPLPGHRSAMSLPFCNGFGRDRRAAPSAPRNSGALNMARRSPASHSFRPLNAGGDIAARCPYLNGGRWPSAK